jgi:hypothetical protein
VLLCCPTFAVLSDVERATHHRGARALPEVSGWAGSMAANPERCLTASCMACRTRRHTGQNSLRVALWLVHAQFTDRALAHR